MGDSVKFDELNEVNCKVANLLTGDVVRVVTNAKSEVLLTSPTDGFVELSYEMQSPGFARIEVLRSFLPGVPMLPALITNPIYFD